MRIIQNGKPPRVLHFSAFHLEGSNNSKSTISCLDALKCRINIFRVCESFNFYLMHSHIIIGLPKVTKSSRVKQALQVHATGCMQNNTQ